MTQRTLSRLTRFAGAAALATLVAAPSAHAQNMRVAGNFSSNSKHVGIEKAFFLALPKLSSLPIEVNYNTMDAVSVQAADALRLLRSGTFDVMSVQIGMASRDDPFFEGVDLIGVSTNMADLRKAVDAYRDVFDHDAGRLVLAKAPRAKAPAGGGGAARRAQRQRRGAGQALHLGVAQAQQHHLHQLVVRPLPKHGGHLLVPRPDQPAVHQRDA